MQLVLSKNTSRNKEFNMKVLAKFYWNFGRSGVIDGLFIADKSEIEKYSEADIEKLDKRLNAQFKKGMTLEKLAKGYSLEELKLVAGLHEIVAEKDDTVETLLQALLEEFESSSKG